MTYINSHSNSSLNSVGSYAAQSNFLRIGERMFSDSNMRMLLMPLLVLGFLFTIGNACGQTTYDWLDTALTATGNKVQEVQDGPVVYGMNRVLVY